MLEILGPFHAIAAPRGEGLLPEFARLLELSQAETAIPYSSAAVAYSKVRKDPRNSDPNGQGGPSSGENVVSFPAKKARLSRKSKA